MSNGTKNIITAICTIVGAGIIVASTVYSQRKIQKSYEESMAELD